MLSNNKTTDMSIIHDNFKKVAREQSDIWKHIPTLNALARDEEVQDKGVYECGFRWGTSTWAFLQAGADVVSVDIEDCDGDLHKQGAEEAGIKFYLRKKDSRNYSPREKPFGLTFLDTIHEYEHLKAELEHVEGFTTKYIAVHDTDQRWERKGKTHTAIMHFLRDNQDWEMYSHDEYCHGLTVITRKTYKD